MKLTVIASYPESDALTSLANSCQKAGVVFDLCLEPELASRSSQDFGEVVMLRSKAIAKDQSLLDQLKILLAGRNLFNEQMFIDARLQSKFFQAQFFRDHLSEITTIPTFRFADEQELLAAIESGYLSYPFIQKPDAGMQGKYVYLRQSKTVGSPRRGDHPLTINPPIDYPHVIFQPYIPNNGDYRILVLGGNVLGVIHRQAIDDKVMNNLSQGAIATIVTDARLSKQLSEMALAITNVFQLDFTGVDVIVDKETGTPYFMEINSIPGWAGFQAATGVDVSEKLIAACPSKLKTHLSID